MPTDARAEEISYPAGSRRVAAHLALPAAGCGRGVVVLHEAWGLDAFVRGVCARLAREGFVALAPDLFDGKQAADLAEAQRLSDALVPERVEAELDGAVRALLSHDAVEGARVGVVGFCLGGHLALVAAARTPRVGAAVDFYGLFPHPPQDAAALAAPLLAIFAGRDAYITQDAVERLRGALRAAGRSASVEVEPDSDHGFMNDTRPDRFDAAAAARGWQRLLAFLRAELA